MRPVLLVFCLLAAVGCRGSQESARAIGVEAVTPLAELHLVDVTQDVAFTETLSERALLFIRSEAQVRVEANVTYKYYLDLKGDGYEMSVDERPVEGEKRPERVLVFRRPELKMQTPIVNDSRVTYPQRGVLVNEEAEAVAILETLTPRLVEVGATKLRDPGLHAEADAALAAYLEGLARQTGLPFDRVEILPLAEPES
jgi:hypothetical protein